jgi:hypothetical protein
LSQNGCQHNISLILWPNASRELLKFYASNS